MKQNIQEKYDWKSVIKLNTIMLQMVGMWPKNEGYNFNFYTLYAIICLNFFVNAHTFFQTMNVILCASNLETLIRTIFVASSEMLVSIKTVYFMYNIRDIKNLLKFLDSTLFQPRNLRQLAMVQQDMYFWKMTYFIFWFFACPAIALFATLPVFTKMIKYYQLPFEAWYPFNTKVSPQFEITYIHQVISFFLMAVVGLNIDTLMAALMAYIGAQCDILSDTIKHLDFSDCKFDECEKKINHCIEHHNEILSFAEVCNGFVSMLILGQLFTSSTIIALTLFRLSLVKPFGSEMIMLSFYVMTAIVEIFIYCLFGDIIETKSSQIPYSAFDSDWTGIPLGAKKNLIILIMKSQKPIKMSAINLFSLSLATFANILRTSWSYFAVLRTVNSPQ